MSKTTVKKPLSAKTNATPFGPPNFFQNKLSVPKDIHDEITSKGLDYRWISYKKFVDEGGSHQWGWTIFKTDKPAGGLEFGRGTDGMIRRGDNVLAVRPLEWSRQHKEYLDTQNKLMSGRGKAIREEMRAMAKDKDVAIDDSYDGSDDEDEE